jgi:hypothetical protein
VEDCGLTCRRGGTKILFLEVCMKSSGMMFFALLTLCALQVPAQEHAKGSAVTGTPQWEKMASGPGGPTGPTWGLWDPPYAWRLRP